MKVTYKFKIGQKVKLTKIRCLNSYCLDKQDCDKLLNQEVTIINRGFDYGDNMYSGPLNKEKLKRTIFYYIAEDPTYRYRTMFYEDDFEGEEFNEVVYEQPVSADGVIVSIGTKLYNHVLIKINDKLQTNCSFTFASEGPCVRISKNYSHWDSYYSPKDSLDEFTFESCREFLCQGNYDGKIYDCGDSRRYGNRDRFDSYEAYTKLPDNFVDLYVSTALDKVCFYGNISIYDKNWAWEIEQWLRHFGVWEQVKELYDSRAPQEPESEETEKEYDNKLNQLLSSLSEEEREKLKEML